MNDNKLVCAVKENPMSVLLLGAFPAMVFTADLKAALAMGIVAFAVLIVSTIIVSALKGIITDGMLIPVTAAITTFLSVSAVMLLEAWLSDVYALLGMYAAVLTVSLIFCGNAGYAHGKSFGKALGNAVLTGLFFLAAMAVTALIREFFGSGSVCGAAVGFMKNLTCAVMTQPAGGFLTYGIVAAIAAKVFAKKEKKA